MDGTLVPGANTPEEFEHIKYRHKEFSQFSLPHIVVNFNKKGIKGIDLSRTAIIDRQNTWAETIWQSYLKYIRDYYENEIKSKAVEERLFDIAQLVFFNRVTTSDLKLFIPFEEWPVPIFTHEGQFDVIDAGNLPEIIYFQPLFYLHFSKFVLAHYQGQEMKKAKLDKWKNETFIICEQEDMSDPAIYSHQVRIILKLAELILSDKYELQSFRFLNADKRNTPPLIQPIYILKSVNSAYLSNHDDIDVIDKVMKPDADLEFYELNILTEVINEESDTNFRINLPRIGIFEAPFADKFAYSYKVLNWKHPIVKVLLKIINLGLMDDIRSETIQTLMDLLNELPFFNHNVALSGCSIDDINRVFFNLATLIKNAGLKVDYTYLKNLYENDFIIDSIFIDPDDGYKIFDFHSRINTDRFSANPDYYKILK